MHGDDITPAQMAWYSTASALTDERLKRVPVMLRQLALGDPPEGLPHQVPFEHTLISFHVTSDIATHIHFLKHRIGVSISSQSQRYMELRKDEWHMPDDYPAEIAERANVLIRQSFDLYHDTIKAMVDSGASRKRAKEAARLVLPYATQISYCVTFNLLSFIHFLMLRNTEHAQREIRELAADMLHQILETGKFNNSLEAFGVKGNI